MDFLEIRRKAKERAEARAHAGATPSREQSEAVATGDARPAAAPSREAVELVPAASEALEAVPRLEPLGAPEPPQREPPEPPLDAIEEAPAAPDFSRLEPFDAVVEAVHAAGGELTPIPDIPPWNEALSPDAEEAGRDGATSARPWAPALAFATPPQPVDPLDEFFYRDGEVVPGLPALDFGAPALAREVEVVDPLHEYLTFRLGDEEYAIDIERVREVLKAPVITDVPRAPAHVLGVIMVRGDVIAVFDPRRRLGLPEVDRPRTSRVLVCDDGLGPIGLLVDTVSQVVRLRRADIEPRPQGIGRVSAEYISGIGRQAGRMFIVLDLPVVLRGKSAADGEEAA